MIFCGQNSVVEKCFLEKIVENSWSDAVNHYSCGLGMQNAWQSVSGFVEN
jgi:hypothetical protein